MSNGSTTYVWLIAFVFLLIFSSSISAQDAAPEGDVAAGKALYNANCAACHKLNQKMTGPALANVEARLYEEEGLDREWLNAWIRNSAALIKSGDVYANKIWNEYNQTAMTAFPQLSDQDITNILGESFKDQLTQLINHTIHQTRSYLTTSDVNNIISQEYA